MTFEVASTFARVFTLFTTKGLLAMNQHVVLQAPNVDGREATDFASVQLLSFSGEELGFSAFPHQSHLDKVVELYRVRGH